MFNGSTSLVVVLFATCASAAIIVRDVSTAADAEPALPEAPSAPAQPLAPNEPQLPAAPQEPLLPQAPAVTQILRAPVQTIVESPVVSRVRPYFVPQLYDADVATVVSAPTARIVRPALDYIYEGDRVLPGATVASELPAAVVGSAAVVDPKLKYAFAYRLPQGFDYPGRSAGARSFSYGYTDATSYAYGYTPSHVFAYSYQRPTGGLSDQP